MAASDSPIIQLRRETIASHIVQLSAGNCSFTYRRLKPGVLLLTIKGDDLGHFGSATLDELNAEFDRFGSMSLYVDAQAAEGPATEVMEAWTAFFASNRKKFKRIVILVLPESKLLHLTVKIVQHLSGVGKLFRIFSDPQNFHTAIKREVPTFTT